MAWSMGFLISGVAGGIALGVAAEPTLGSVGAPVMAVFGMAAGAKAMMNTLTNQTAWPLRLSRRYREHEAIMADVVTVPAVAGRAFDDVKEAAKTLRSLSAPDMAIAYAVEAREEAADALVALASLAKVSPDPVWLATTDPYRRVLTLAAEVTVLEHLCKDRLALPHNVGTAVVPEGMQTAEEVGAYLLSENQTVARALAPAAVLYGA